MNCCFQIALLVALMTALQIQKASGGSPAGTNWSSQSKVFFNASLASYFANVSQTEVQSNVVSLPAVPTIKSGQLTVATASFNLVHIDIYNQTNVVQNVILPMASTVLNISTVVALENEMNVVVNALDGSPLNFNIYSSLVPNVNLTAQIAHLITFLNGTDQLQLPFDNKCDQCNGKEILINFLQLVCSLTNIRPTTNVTIQSSTIAVLTAVVEVFVQIDDVVWQEMLNAINSADFSTTYWLGQFGQYIMATLLVIVKNLLPPQETSITNWPSIPTSAPNWHPVKPTLPISHPASPLQVISSNIGGFAHTAALSVPKGIGSALQTVSGDFQSIISKLNSQQNGIGKILQTVSGTVQGIVSDLTSKQSGTINFQNIITSITNVISQLIYGVIQLPENFVKDIQSLSAGAVANVDDLISGLTQTSGQFFPLNITHGISGFLQTVSGNVKGLVTQISSGKGSLLNLHSIIIAVQKFISQFIKNFEQLPIAVVTVIQSLSAGVSADAGKLISGLTQTSGQILPSNFFQGVSEFITAVSGDVKGLLNTIDSQNGVHLNIFTIIPAIQQFIEQIVKDIAKLPENFVSTIKSLSGGIISETNKIVSSFAQTSGQILPFNITKVFQSGQSGQIGAFSTIKSLSSFGSKVLPCITSKLTSTD